MRGKLWVITHHIHSEPKLAIWGLIEERPSCYLVDLRGNTKVMKKDTMGRHYFLTEDAALNYLKRSYKMEQADSHRTTVKMTKLLAKDDQFLLRYAAGHDKEALQIAKETIP